MYNFTLITHLNFVIVKKPLNMIYRVNKINFYNTFFKTKSGKM